MPLIETTATSYRATAKTGRAMCAIAATVGCLGLLQACNASDIGGSALPASAAVDRELGASLCPSAIWTIELGQEALCALSSFAVQTSCGELGLRVEVGC